MTDSSKLLIAIATYNELDNLPLLVDKLFELFPAAHILIVDDNSPDGTPDWLEQQTRSNQQLHSIVRPSKQGLGTAAREIFVWAVGQEFQFVATMDADFSHAPDDLVDLGQAIQATPDIDVVIGSRYVPGGKIVGWSWFRRLASRLINIHSRFWLKLPTKDNSSAFRVYRTSILKKIDPSRLQSRGYVYLQEMLWRLKHVQASVVELPITFRDRIRGNSKINYREAFAAVGTIIRLAFAKP